MDATGDRGPLGGYYGWPAQEGVGGGRFPVAHYSCDSTATACAITGGTFYNPVVQQFLNACIGRYFFADFCAGWVRALDSQAVAADFGASFSQPVDLNVRPDGGLYVLARGAGQVIRVLSTGSPGTHTLTTAPPGLSVVVDALHSWPDSGADSHTVVAPAQPQPSKPSIASLPS